MQLKISFITHKGQYDLDFFRSFDKIFGLINYEKHIIIINLAYGLHRAIDALLHELGHAFLWYVLFVPGESKIQSLYDLITYFLDPFMSITDKRYCLIWLWDELSGGQLDGHHT